MDNTISAQIQIPLPQLSNPFFGKIKTCKLDILTRVIKNIDVKKRDITYIMSNATNKHSCGKEYKIHAKNIDRYVHTLSNGDFKLMALIDDPIVDTSHLNNDEIIVASNMVNTYKTEYIRVLHIKQHFIHNYIDATKLKNAHLSDACANRQHITSKCNIKQFVNAIKPTTLNKTVSPNKNDEFALIMTEYSNILQFNGVGPIPINNRHAECCFILNKIYGLFNYYLDVLLYCMQLINMYPYITREPHYFLFDIGHNNCYFYEESDGSICINHMELILNVTVEKNNKIHVGNFIKLYKTSKRNNVYFIDNPIDDINNSMFSYSKCNSITM